MHISEHRLSERALSQLETACTSSGQTFVVEVSNVSSGGCLIEATGLELAEGNSARIRFPEFGTFDGTVIWSEGGRAGLAFTEQVHAAVVLYIANRTNAAIEPEVSSAADDKPRDRFGRPLPAAPCPSTMMDTPPR